MGVGRTRWNRPRSGTVYLVVLGVTMVVSVMALASLNVSRLELRASGSNSDRREARGLARTAVEYALAYIENERDWRKEFTNNTREATIAFGNGSFAFKLVDDDGDLDDGDNHGCTLYGYGFAGGATAVESVRLQAGGTALDCLEVALCVDAGFTLPAGNLFAWKHIYTDQTVAANGAIDAQASFATIHGDAWAAGAIAGDVTGTKDQNNGTPRVIPGKEVFDYYVANGTRIDIGSLPTSGGRRQLYHRVLSPATNPFGDTNREGIYVIDCEGEHIRISESRIVGTLVLLNNGANSDTDSALCWEPAVANYPALLVENNFTFDHQVLVLSEPFDGVNYNPPGTPIDGDENTNTSDTHPFRFRGVVYVGGQLRSAEHLETFVRGCVVCGSLQNDAIGTFNYSDVYFNYPPPGFRAGDTMEIVPGSWRRAADDGA